MSADPWVQRFDERAEEDERYARRLQVERVDRLTEQGPLEPWQAGVAISALQPDLAALPSLAYQGTPPVRPIFWPRLKRWAFLVGFVVLGLVLALAVAVTLIEAVAWFMDGP